MIELFSKYGSVASAEVMTGGDGKVKGFGFVSFKNAEQLQKVAGHCSIRCFAN